MFENKDVLTLARTIIENTTVPETDEFGVKMETALLQAVLFALRDVSPSGKHSLKSIAVFFEDGAIESLIEQARANNPDTLALKQYELCKQAMPHNKSARLALQLRMKSLVNIDIDFNNVQESIINKIAFDDSNAETPKNYKIKIINEIKKDETQSGEKFRERFGDVSLDNFYGRVMDMPMETHEKLNALQKEFSQTLKQAFETGNPSCDLAQKACEMFLETMSVMHDGLTWEILAQTLESEQNRKEFDEIVIGGGDFLHEAIKKYRETKVSGCFKTKEEFLATASGEWADKIRTIASPEFLEFIRFPQIMFDSGDIGADEIKELSAKEPQELFDFAIKKYINDFANSEVYVKFENKEQLGHYLISAFLTRFILLNKDHAEMLDKYKTAFAKSAIDALLYERKNGVIKIDGNEKTDEIGNQLLEITGMSKEELRELLIYLSKELFESFGYFLFAGDNQMKDDTLREFIIKPAMASFLTVIQKMANEKGMDFDMESTRMKVMHLLVPKNAADSPQDKATKLQKDGDKHRKAKEYEPAIDCYSKAIGLMESNDAPEKAKLAECYYHRAWSNVYLKQYAEGLKDCGKALELGYGHPEYCYNLFGYVYRQPSGLRDYAKALENLDKAVDLDSKYAVPLYGRSYVKMKLGEYPSALVDIEKALELKPDSEKYLKRKAEITEKLGK